MAASITLKPGSKYRAVGEKVFLEMYWLDPETGFTGQTTYDSKVCETEAEAEAEGYVKRNKITMADLKPESHVSECDVFKGREHKSYLCANAVADG